jgi:ParB-like chromosome segregation protein Spo0J
MTGPSPTKTINVKLGDINVTADRLRALHPHRVAEIAESMRNRLLQPIVLRTGRGNSYHLVAGRHRLEAAKLLKWPSIRAVIFEGMKASEAELGEIDENLVRFDLSPAERAMHAARRKELYEELFPETKRGATGRGGKKDRKLRSFVDDVAAKSGKDRARVAREAKRGKDIPTEVLSAVIGTSLDKGDELDALANLPPDRRNKLAAKAAVGEKVSAKTELKKAKRTDRERELGAKQRALPDQKFGVILEDYEWDFQVFSRETGMDRHAANHYPVSEDAHTAQEIVERTKDRLACAADDCALFMYGTVPHLAIAIDVLRLRGFRYVTNWTWDKIKAGTGYWNRNRHEHLLLGIKGNVPCPAPGQQWESLLRIEATEHSAKPEQFLEMIEAYFPNLPKIELNRRGPPRPNWSAWGLEAEESTPDTD